MGVEPPVEGFSNFLWTALMALVRTLGGDMVAVAPWLSFLLGAVLIVLVFRHNRMSAVTAIETGDRPSDLDPSRAVDARLPANIWRRFVMGGMAVDFRAEAGIDRMVRSGKVGIRHDYSRA